MADNLRPILQTIPFGGAVENAEISIKNLYMHQIHSGPNTNQEHIVRGHGDPGFGTTTVINWAIYDRDSEDKTVVARAQGLHIAAGNRHNSFTLVFEAGRFQGSTLQVMGASVENSGSWAILGGTGDLSMARGTIQRKKHRPADHESGDILLIQIHAYCTLKGGFPAYHTSRLWGGDMCGFVKQTITNPWRLESVTIRAENIIDSFKFSYINQNGVRHTEGQWGDGGGRGDTTTINLAPKEYVTGLSGTYSAAHDQIVLNSLTLVTNFRTYIRIGASDGHLGTPFNAEIPTGHIIVGFHARSDKYVNAIGVYTMDTMAMLT